MKIIITLLIFASYSQFTQGQYCVPNRFDTLAFSLNEIDSILNQPYGQNYNWQDTTIQNLKMDVYFPKSSLDPLPKRPLIVMIHSGGFYLGRRQQYRHYCRDLARKGFVVATIDYRIGWDVGLGQHYDTLPIQTQVGYPFNCLGDSASSIKALYRALQDEKAAIRYLVHNADTVINVDTNYIFVAGGSAGGVSALGLQYLPQTFFDTNFGYLNLKGTLGALDSVSNSLTESFSLAGLISMWGAVPDTAVITEFNSLPTLMIHCTGDTLVPCISSNYYTCINYAPAQGSCVIKNRLENLNQCYEFNYYNAPFPQNGCHDVYTFSYHVERISKFAKRVMCNDCRQITIENQIELTNNSVATEVLDNLNAYEVIIYPNPSKTNINVSSNSNISTLIIVNLLGEIVKKNSVNNKSTNLDVEELTSGVYILIVKLENGNTISKKIIIK